MSTGFRTTEQHRHRHSSSRNALRVMHIISSLDRGGAELMLLALCRNLVRGPDRVDVKVVVLFDMLGLLPRFEKGGVSVECLRLPRRGFFIKLFRTWAVIRRWRPDIVHTHLTHADRHGQLAALLAGVRGRICSVHNMEHGLPWQERLTRHAAGRLSTHLVAVSHAVKDMCARTHICAARKIAVIHNAPGFSPPAAVHTRHLPPADTPLAVISIGNFGVQKGQVYLVRAMKLLSDRDMHVELRLYGTSLGGYGAVLENEVAKLEPGHRIFIHGPTEDVRGVLDAAHVLVASSLWEGFHMVVVEAMSMGIPVIATDISPHRELLEGVEDALLVEPGSPEHIAAAVTTLSRDPSLYERLSAQGRRRSRHFSEQNMVGRYRDLYASIARGRRDGRARACGSPCI